MDKILMELVKKYVPDCLNTERDMVQYTYLGNFSKCNYVELQKVVSMIYSDDGEIQNLGTRLFFRICSMWKEHPSDYVELFRMKSRVRVFLRRLYYDQRKREAATNISRGNIPTN